MVINDNPLIQRSTVPRWPPIWPSAPSVRLHEMSFTQFATSPSSTIRALNTVVNKPEPSCGFTNPLFTSHRLTVCCSLRWRSFPVVCRLDYCFSMFLSTSMSNSALWLVLIWICWSRILSKCIKTSMRSYTVWPNSQRRFCCFPSENQKRRCVIVIWKYMTERVQCCGWGCFLW